MVGELSGGGEGGRKVGARVEGASVEVALGELVEGDAVIKDMVEAFEGDRVLFVARDENTKRSKVNKAALSLDTIMTNLAAQ